MFYSNRSACLSFLGDFEAAVEDGRKCIQLAPEWPKGYGRLGLALFRSGDHMGAMTAYQTGLAQDPENESLTSGLAECRADKARMDAIAAQAAAAKIADGAAAADTAPPTEHVIGIDLGTTFSCVAVWRNGEPEVLANDLGARTTPSWVAFTDTAGERLVGEGAKNQAARNTSRTLFNIKRIIGRQFSECHEDTRRMPFEIKEGKAGKPVICVTSGEGEKAKNLELMPEQVSAMVLEKMKKAAEVALDTKISKAVVTVPAYFNDAQRRLTKDAGTIAGLDVLRVINEPTAAALAYGLDKAKGVSQKVLVFDLGGGTFDVSLLSIEDGVFSVMATSGDTHLGGEDFDSAIADWVAQDHRKRTGEDPFTDSPGATRKLRSACETAKRQLSSSTSARVEITVGDQEISCEVTRAKFERLCENTFQRCLECVKRVLTDSKQSKEDVDEIVLVGGSTRVPRVQAILQEFFDGKQLCKSVHPDEAVAYGAAVQGAILAGVRDGGMDNMLLVDVIPLSIGVECEGRQMAKVVPRNTPVPCKKSSEFTTVEDYQTEIDVRIFEGERETTDGNHLLGEFNITGIERAKRGEAKIDVTMEVSTNGLLTVVARDKVTGAKANVEIAHDRGRLSNEEVEAMVAEAERMREEDERVLAEEGA